MRSEQSEACPSSTGRSWIPGKYCSSPRVVEGLIRSVSHVHHWTISEPEPQVCPVTDSEQKDSIFYSYCHGWSVWTRLLFTILLYYIHFIVCVINYTNNKRKRYGHRGRRWGIGDSDGFMFVTQGKPRQVSWGTEPNILIYPSPNGRSSSGSPRRVRTRVT